MSLTFNSGTSPLLAPARHDEPRRLHSCEVLGGLKADASVRPRDYDILALQIGVEGPWHE